MGKQNWDELPEKEGRLMFNDGDIPYAEEECPEDAYNLQGGAASLPRKKARENVNGVFDEEEFEGDFDGMIGEERDVNASGANGDEVYEDDERGASEWSGGKRSVVRGVSDDEANGGESEGVRGDKRSEGSGDEVNGGAAGMPHLLGVQTTALVPVEEAGAGGGEKRGTSLFAVLGGGIIGEKFLRRNWGLIAMIIVLSLVYTSNRYMAEQEIIKISDLNRELSEVRIRALTHSCELTSNCRQSRVEERLHALGDSTFRLSHETPLRIVRKK